MSMSGAEMAAMVAVLRDAGMDADAIAEACERVAAAGILHAVQVRKRSPGAVRQARYRARLRAEQSVTEVTGSDACVTPVETAETPANAGIMRSAASQVTSPASPKRHFVTGRAKKERSPTPPKEKTTPSSQKGFRPQPSQAVSGKSHILRSDPIFATIEAMRGKPMPTDDRGGWNFDVGEIERAKARLRPEGSHRLSRPDKDLDEVGSETEIKQIEAVR